MRQTGRTVRQLAKALALAREGKVVVLVSERHEMAQLAFRRVRELCGPDFVSATRECIRFQGGGQFRSVRDADYRNPKSREDLRALDAVVMCDHFVYEARLAELRREAERDGAEVDWGPSSTASPRGRDENKRPYAGHLPEEIQMWLSERD